MTPCVHDKKCNITMIEVEIVGGRSDSWRIGRCDIVLE